ncbi:hypothetical protein BU23DRAFT_53718 [Bimuria novae-zelandiae CBS 107.79]|uniref:Uncharacterized protein n=1 Tax=Bimuria novae-zelandiae CBS 107.79 TaxID=1447943 RepID=A0A6A5UNY1_9PLEO|nr:hypothetical protein BU23DRAFT_53718 [Bimuria novae-zelandiae CBS 107.79]
MDKQIDQIIQHSITQTGGIEDIIKKTIVQAAFPNARIRLRYAVLTSCCVRGRELRTYVSLGSPVNCVRTALRRSKGTVYTALRTNCAL